MNDGSGSSENAVSCRVRTHETEYQWHVVKAAEVCVVKSKRPPVTIRQKTGVQKAMKPAPVLGTEVRAKAGHWVPGVSGNPAGRPRGSRNVTHRDLLNILAAHGEQVVSRVIMDAIAGDQSAAKLVLDRILPRSVCEPKSSIPYFHVRSATDARAAMGMLVEMTMTGEMTPVEAERIANVFEAYRRTLDSAGIEERLRRLEQSMDADQ